MTTENCEKLSEARLSIYFARNSTQSSETYEKLSDVLRALETAIDRCEIEALTPKGHWQ